MPEAVVPMPLAELLERLKYAGLSSTCTFEPAEARRMHATVLYLEATLADERAARHKLEGQLAAAQRDFEALDAKLAAAAAKEREACAELYWEMADRGDCIDDIFAAIRARGDRSKKAAKKVSKKPSKSKRRAA